MKIRPKIFRQYFRLYGFQGLSFAFRQLISKPCTLVSHNRKGITHPIYFRLGTTDSSAFKQVFMHDEYNVRLKKQPKTLIDAGANIGLTSIYFANKYPECKIIAIEPEPSNFDVLLRNTEPYTNIIALHAALWDSPGTIQLFDPDEGHFGFQARADNKNHESAVGTVRAVSIDSIMADLNIEHIDYLKIDIEGAEKQVFDNCANWINNVSLIVIELHDRFTPGCTDSFNRATKEFDIRRERGENIFVSKADWL